MKLLTVLDEMTLHALEKVQTILLSWERKYHNLWDQDINAYMRWVLALLLKCCLWRWLQEFIYSDRCASVHRWIKDKLHSQLCRRYAKVQRSFDEFKADIQDFHNMKNKILMESPSEIVLFINIDCQPIKQVKHLKLITSISKIWHW